MGAVIAVHYFFGKPPQPPKVNPFFVKHKDAIRQAGDIFLAFVVCICWIPLIYMFASRALKSVLNPGRVPLPLMEQLKYAVEFFSIGAMYASGLSGGLIGLLSVFQSKLTNGKRLFLLVISLLPIVFTAILIFTTPVEEPQYFGSLIKNGLASLFECLIINGPAIIFGQHFIRVSWSLMRKLKLVSGEFPE